MMLPETQRTTQRTTSRTIKQMFITVLITSCLASFVYAQSASELPKASVIIGKSSESSDRCAVLIHGLARSSASMNKLSRELNKAGWHTANVDYPSRKFPIALLAPAVLDAGVSGCRKMGAEHIDGVGHSLGGILFRQFTQTETIEGFGRFVMLGSPNHGSEVVDNLRNVPGFAAFNGPAGLELGTEASSVPNSLGEAKYDTAVIAGTSSINLLLSIFLPNPDDGKVSVESAKLAGMCAMLTVPVSHPLLMKDDTVIVNVVSYLASGKFTPQNENTPDYPACEYRFDR